MLVWLPRAFIVLAVGALSFLLLQPRDQPSLLTLEGSTMGTRWSVQLNTRSGDTELQSLASEIEFLLETLDKGIFSTWNQESELSRLNNSPRHQGHAASPELLQVLATAAAVHQASFGAFDPTIAPLVSLWGFGPQGHDSQPEHVEIVQAQSLLGMDKLLLDSDAGTMTLAGDIELDLSGIAKGYAVDRLADMLLARGEAHFLVDIGGEVRVSGLREDGNEWRIGIEMPHPGPRSAMARIAQQGRPLALATSGDYRNFRLNDGKRLSHEIDPRSGYPVDHALASVTVIADSAMLADAWATALMVLGPREGPELANSLELNAYFIIRSEQGFESRFSAGMAEYLELDSPGY
jgi:FAD:protein FMN transferase